MGIEDSSSQSSPPATVPFLDLAADYALVRDQVELGFKRVLNSQVFVLGEQTRRLEKSMAELTGVKHALACSSGTDALYLALLAAGIGSGDAVLVPSFTFFATAGAVARTGAKPVFVDLDENSFLSGAVALCEALDREFERRGADWFHRRDGARLRAAMVVHLFGRVGDFDRIRDLFSASNVLIIEDAAQAIGAHYRRTSVGGLGSIACFSFYPTKNVGGAGDAGMVTTTDDDFAAALRSLRVHGASGDGYIHERCGINARMSELQAAYLNAKLPRLEEFTAARRRVAVAYREGLARLADRGRIVLPHDGPAASNVWHQYTVRVVGDRDRTRQRLAAAGVESRVFYPVPMHLQPAFSALGYRAGDLPRSEKAAAEVLSLPIYPALGTDAVARVCEALAGALAP